MCSLILFAVPHRLLFHMCFNYGSECVFFLFFSSLEIVDGVVTEVISRIVDGPATEEEEEIWFNGTSTQKGHIQLKLPWRPPGVGDRLLIMTTFVRSQRLNLLYI
jgi:hypothetical protein